MSQAGIASITNIITPPNVPTQFDCDVGIAIPAANIIVCHGVGGVFSGSGNTITFTTAGAGFPWVDESVSFLASSTTGYFCTNSLTATLPPSPSQGDVISIYADTALSITIQANTSQFIQLGNAISSSSGSASCLSQGNSITLVYRASSLTWNTTSVQGSWTLI